MVRSISHPSPAAPYITLEGVGKTYDRRGATFEACVDTGLI
jgi:hypothetical protein